MVHFSLVSRSSYARREGSSDEDTLLLEVEPPTADRGDVRTIKNIFYKSGSALLVWIALQEKAGGIRLGAIECESETQFFRRKTPRTFRHG